jgi:hypothetical protein
MQEFDAKSEYLRKLKKIDICHLIQFFYIIKPISQCTQRWGWQLGSSSGSLVVAAAGAVAAAWWQWQWQKINGNIAAVAAAARRPWYCSGSGSVAAVA